MLVRRTWDGEPASRHSCSLRVLRTPYHVLSFEITRSVTARTQSEYSVPRTKYVVLGTERTDEERDMRARDEVLGTAHEVRCTL